jgi:cell division protein ZapA
MSRDVKVDIFGQEFTIRGELPAEYVRELALLVDAKMRTVAQMTSMVDTQKIAVLAALAIADDLKSLRDDGGRYKDQLKEQAERCLTLVERALKRTE